ncbi:amidohydrolase family protein [Roseiterribacter gracilis]|uniref:TolB protein n=1 Tax=Roseiterribacter gracilis TaxID=2812848 RepID=A0A8S8XCS4_9PROT|nr:TolB protein [Rhodospirillales bacterium TMPK1]
MRRRTSLLCCSFVLSLLAFVSPVHAHEPVQAPDHAVSEAARTAGQKPAAARPVQLSGSGLPLEAARTLAFTVQEGTWLSPDLSPDGRQIVFEMLGDLYLVDARGGTARAIATGMAFDSQPAFSPDGKQIVFLSDRSGSENVWIADADGRNPRAVTTHGDDSIFTSPAWSADARTIYVSRYDPAHAAFALQAIEVATGKTTVIVPIAGEPSSSTVGAAASRDGKWLYYASQVGPHDGDPPGWVIRRRDLRAGTEETLVEPPRSYRPDLVLGTFFRPIPSPDGSKLVYATRYGAQLWLRVLDLRTRDDRWLVRLTQLDELVSAPWRDLAPHYAFTPDSAALVVNDGGKLRRVSLADSATTEIEFTAYVQVPLGPLNAPVIREETGPVRARIIQHPMESPDGTQLTFSALGHVYVMPLAPGGKPRRLTQDQIGEFEPSWSADGRSILYVRWSARDGGHVWRVPADGNGAPVRLTDVAAYYTSPVETPDGRSVLVLRSSNVVRMHRYMEYGVVRDAELAMLPAQGGAARTVAAGNMGGVPHFGPDPARVALLFNNGLNLVSLADGKRQLLLQVTGPGYYFSPGRAPVQDLRLSPDGKTVLAQIAQQLHLLELPAKLGTTIDLAAPGVRHRRLTDVGADFLQWSADGRTIGWAIGSSWFRRPLAGVALRRAGEAPGAPDVGTPVRSDADVQIPRASNPGALVLRGATAIAVPGTAPIADADILIVDGRFAAVGARGSFPVPDGATIRDVGGKWIVPGFIDDHDHVADVRRGVLDVESWGPAANLSYGITTAFDPSTLTIDLLPYQDLIDAGLMIGSRIRSTGVALFSFNEFASKTDVDRVLDRYRDYYRLDNIKLYRTGSRRVRQWIAQSARERGLRVTAEGATSDKLDLTQVQDGISGLEHALPAAPLAADVITLFAKSGVSYNLTLMVNGGGQDRFIVDRQPNHDPKLNRFAPRFIVDMKTRKRQWREAEDDPFPAFAEGGAQIVRAGGVVGIGSHGEIPGLGFHWEMQAHVRGGWTPVETLRAGTIGSAEAIGRSADLGTIEKGKIADLVVLDRDPLIDIRNAEAISHVMQGGRLYDAATLNEVWPRQRAFPRPWHWDDYPPGAPNQPSNADTNNGGK